MIACGCHMLACQLTTLTDRLYHGVSTQVSCSWPSRCQLPQFLSIQEERTCSPLRGVCPLYRLRLNPPEACRPGETTYAGGGTLRWPGAVGYGAREHRLVLLLSGAYRAVNRCQS
jgi:hypothetical protein